MKHRVTMLAVILAALLLFGTPPVARAQTGGCEDLPAYEQVQTVLRTVVEAGDSGGLGFHMWATLVDRDGEVCLVTFSGEERGDQWPGSRVISAQKANTANAFSLPELSLSTANLYSAVQPGNSLFGLQHSNPVDTAVAYGGSAVQFGQPNDPMVGKRVGGVNVFGGGLPLYDANGVLLGGLGVSGDTSCTDHTIAWKVRDALDLDYVPGGVSDTGDDNIVYDETSSWAHPECGEDDTALAAELPTMYPTGEAMDSPALNQGFVVYANDELGISFSHPEAWSLTEDVAPGAAGMILAESVAGCADDGDLRSTCALVGVIVAPAEELDLVTGDPVDALTTFLEEEMIGDEVQVVSAPAPTTVDGLPAATVQLTIVEGDTPITLFVTMIPTVGDRVVMLMGGAAKEIAGELLPVVQAVMDTLTIGEPLGE